MSKVVDKHMDVEVQGRDPKSTSVHKSLASLLPKPLCTIHGL